jgi:hypothetical protein
MSLKSKMKAIAAISKTELNKLKKHAEDLTAEHEELNSEVDKHAHSYAKKAGFSPSKNVEHHRLYEEHKAHYEQHVLHEEHPELHKRRELLSHRAPQARVAYKRALRS